MTIRIPFQPEDIQIVKLETLSPNPKNRNKHTPEQINRLADLIKHHGFRVPIIVSRMSGLIVAGHGRLLAAQQVGLKEVPVIYQDFDPKLEEEYSFGIADNAIGAWASLDYSGINQDIVDLGPDFNVEMLGMQSFKIDFSEKNEAPKKEPQEKSCPSCGYCF